MVHVDILEIGLPQNGSSRRGDEATFEVLLRSLAIPPIPNALAGLVQLTNCLNVSLKNQRSFVGGSERHNDFPTVILPSRQEVFLISSNTLVQLMLSFEIDSTDLGFMVALRVEGNSHSFSVAFAPLPIDTDQSTFNSSMNPEQWKMHLYRKLANALDGEQEIQMRNIRARVSMSSEAKSCLKIRVFAV
jgi:hypothetical protein